jgi:hypothetical protein
MQTTETTMRDPLVQMSMVVALWPHSWTNVITADTTPISTYSRASTSLSFCVGCPQPELAPLPLSFRCYGAWCPVFGEG